MTVLEAAYAGYYVDRAGLQLCPHYRSLANILFWIGDSRGRYF